MTERDRTIKQPHRLFLDQAASSPFDQWNNSRSGAWANRGFHYQHLVSTLVLVAARRALLVKAIAMPLALHFRR